MDRQYISTTALLAEDVKQTARTEQTIMGCLSFLPACLVLCIANDVSVGATSPSGHVRIGFSLRPAGEAERVPHYSVLFRGTEVVAASRLGLELEGGAMLGGPCELVGHETRTVRDEFVQVSGKRRKVDGVCTETVVRLRESTAPKRMWEVVFRAYDDGAAFRYRIPAQEGWTELAVASERTEFRLPGDTKAYALPLGGFTTSYETRYRPTPVKELPDDWLLGLPLLCELPGGGFAAVTEASVNEFAGMYLAPNAGVMAARLSPLPAEPALVVRAPLPHASPWRVVMLGDRAGRLVESDIVLCLSEPCALTDTSWIQTGKTTFPWWNGFFEERVDFKPGLNTATAKYYIDFCAEYGIPYHSLDGVGNTAWYGGPITPWQGAAPLQGVDGLDLPEVVEYAKAKGVRLRLWMNWQAAHAFMDQAFPLYREWGVEGIMLDFMDRDDQQMNRFIRKAVALAAENQLTVTLHGCPKPTGLERTYPNLLTHEGVMNLEYNKWDMAGITSDHELTVPFTRMLAGPLDFHQGSLRTVKPGAFTPRNEAPLVMGTPARTLASYVVYQNHLSMVADYPTAYRGHPATRVLAAIPTTWDDTRVLEDRVGEFVVIARRNESNWHIGAMTNGEARELKLPLNFLGQGTYTLHVWHDDASSKFGLAHRSASVRAGDVIDLHLESGGGAYSTLSLAGK